jgi:hypothetical protein
MSVTVWRRFTCDCCHIMGRDYFVQTEQNSTIGKQQWFQHWRLVHWHLKGGHGTDTGRVDHAPAVRCQFGTVRIEARHAGQLHRVSKREYDIENDVNGSCVWCIPRAVTGTHRAQSNGCASEWLHGCNTNNTTVLWYVREACRSSRFSVCTYQGAARRNKGVDVSETSVV